MPAHPPQTVGKANKVYMDAVDWCRDHGQNWITVEEHRHLGIMRYPIKQWTNLLDVMFIRGVVTAVELPAKYWNTELTRFPVVHRIHHPDLDHHATEGGVRN